MQFVLDSSFKSHYLLYREYSDEGEMVKKQYMDIGMVLKFLIL